MSAHTFRPDDGCQHDCIAAWTSSGAWRRSGTEWLCRKEALALLSCRTTKAKPQPNALDFIVVHGLATQIARIKQLLIKSEWVLRTGHMALQVNIRREASENNDMQQERHQRRCEGGSHRYVLLNRRRNARRKWPGWSEETPGEFSELIPHSAWGYVANLQRTSIWGGTGCSAEGRAAEPTDLVRQHRETSACRASSDEGQGARRALALWVLKVRDYQRRWRLEHSLQELTQAGRSAAKQVKPWGLVLSCSGSRTGMCQEYRTFWDRILVAPRETRESEKPQLEPPDGLRPEGWIAKPPLATTRSTPLSRIWTLWFYWLEFRWGKQAATTVC